MYLNIAKSIVSTVASLSAAATIGHAVGKNIVPKNLSTSQCVMLAVGTGVLSSVVGSTCGKFAEDQIDELFGNKDK